MQNKKNLSDNQIVLPHSNRIQWVAVGHTHMHIYNKTDNQIYGMILNAKKTGKLFSRKLVQFFNGHKGLTNSAHPNNPLVICHLHTGKLNRPTSTIHYHFAFGNIPASFPEQYMFTVFRELWVTKAEQSNKSIWLQKANTENIGWMHYGHNEHKLHKHLGLDINSTFIPLQA